LELGSKAKEKRRVKREKKRYCLIFESTGSFRNFENSTREQREEKKVEGKDPALDEKDKVCGFKLRKKRQGAREEN